MNTNEITILVELIIAISLFGAVIYINCKDWFMLKYIEYLSRELNRCKILAIRYMCAKQPIPNSLLLEIRRLEKRISRLPTCEDDRND